MLKMLNYQYWFLSHFYPVVGLYDLLGSSQSVHSCFMSIQVNKCRDAHFYLFSNKDNSVIYIYIILPFFIPSKYVRAFVSGHGDINQSFLEL